jgi:hypothetical protein
MIQLNTIRFRDLRNKINFSHLIAYYSNITALLTSDISFIIKSNDTMNTYQSFFLSKQSLESYIIQKNSNDLHKN